MEKDCSSLTDIAGSSMEFSRRHVRGCMLVCQSGGKMKNCVVNWMCLRIRCSHIRKESLSMGVKYVPRKSVNTSAMSHARAIVS